ncbi:hypothetical protein ASZ90_000256 [hydrocarbon metagenome]|uniref:Uncharacterized protein n=1 Tax=hydrocarbon metagenome TaxID=938273 RepID=A0A0W8G9P8_9ZZZZ
MVRSARRHAVTPGRPGPAGLDRRRRSRHNASWRRCPAQARPRGGRRRERP